MQQGCAAWLHEVMHEQTASRFGTWYLRHRWFLDPIAIMLLSIVVAAFGFRGIWGSFSVLSGAISPWWALVLAVPGCALMLLKRRAPMRVLAVVAVLFVVDLLTIGGIGTLLVLLDVLWTAVFVAEPRTRRWLQFTLFLSVVIVFAFVMFFAGEPFSIAFLIAVQWGAIFGTTYWWAVALSQANELADLQRSRAEAAERESERDRAEAVRSEREMMARELHDAVAGHVMAMAIRAEAALSTTPDEAGDRAALQAVRDAGLDAHTALRSMITVLRKGDGELIAQPRWEDLDGVIESARRAGLEVALSQTSERFPVIVEQAIVRIVREALANGIRHAGGARVSVDITATGASATVHVTSWGGAPVAHAPGNGWGLSMLEERVRALEGDFRAGPTDDGWTVAAELPLGVHS